MIQNLRQKRSTTWRKTSESWDAGLSKREKRAFCTFRALNWKEAFSKDAPTSSSSSADLFEGVCLIEKALFLLELKINQLNWSQPYYQWESDLDDYGTKRPDEATQSYMATGFRGLQTFTHGLYSEDLTAHVRVKK